MVKKENNKTRNWVLGIVLVILLALLIWKFSVSPAYSPNEIRTKEQMMSFLDKNSNIKTVTLTITIPKEKMQNFLESTEFNELATSQGTNIIVRNGRVYGSIFGGLACAVFPPACAVLA